MNINEAKLSRVWQMAEGRSFAILTAFRSEYSREENLERNAQLANEIRSFGAGFWILDGVWVENPQSDNPVSAKEDSFFVSVPAGEGLDLVRFVYDSMRKYDQEAAVIKPSAAGKVYLLLANGSRKSIGQFSPNAVAQAYSQIRKTGQSFVFESARSAGGWANAMAEATEPVTMEGFELTVDDWNALLKAKAGEQIDPDSAKWLEECGMLIGGKLTPFAEEWVANQQSAAPEE